MTGARPSWVRHLVPVSWVLLMGGLAATYRTKPALASWSVFELAAMATLEAALLFALLRPLSFQYHTGRSLLALVALVVTSTWWAARAPLIAAPAYTVHLLWLMGLVVAVCVLLGFSLWQQLMQRHR